MGLSVRRMRVNYYPPVSATHVSAQMCANVRRAQALVDSHSYDVHMEPPMDCEKYKTSKNNVLLVRSRSRYNENTHVSCI